MCNLSSLYIYATKTPWLLVDIELAWNNDNNGIKNLVKKQRLWVEQCMCGLVLVSFGPPGHRRSCSRATISRSYSSWLQFFLWLIHFYEEYIRRACDSLFAGCNEDVLLEAVAIQQPFYQDDTRPETSNGIICAQLKPGSHRGFLSWPVYSSLSPVESLKLSRYWIRHEFGISWKPADYSALKRSSASQTKINNGNWDWWGNYTANQVFSYSKYDEDSATRRH